MASVSEENGEQRDEGSQAHPTGRISGSGLPPPINDTTTTTTNTHTTATTTTVNPITTVANATLPPSAIFPSSTFRVVSTIPSAPLAPPPVPICGHAGGFVQPSSYLRSRPPYPMPVSQPERAIDREERQGLVSLFFLFLLHPCRLSLDFWRHEAWSVSSHFTMSCMRRASLC